MKALLGWGLHDWEIVRFVFSQNLCVRNVWVIKNFKWGLLNEIFRCVSSVFGSYVIAIVVFKAGDYGDRGA